MTPSNTAVETRREDARQSDGKFGKQILDPSDKPLNQQRGSMTDEQYADWTSSADELDDLSYNPDPWVRTLVARNPHTDDATVERLKDDDSPGVRREVYMRRDSTPSEVEDGWDRGCLSPTDVASHPEAPSTALYKAAVAEIADAFPPEEMKNQTYMMLATHENADNRVWRTLINASDSNTSVLIRCADETTDGDDLRTAYEWAVANPNVPGSEMLMRKIAYNDSTPPEVLNKMPREFDGELADNHNTPADRLDLILRAELSDEGGPGDNLRRAAANPAISDQTRNWLMNHPLNDARAMVVQNPHMTKDELRQMATSDEDAWVRHCAQRVFDRNFPKGY